MQSACKTMKKILVSPEMRGVELGNPRNFMLYRERIRKKGMLKKIYSEWYSFLAGQIPAMEGRVLELGAGGGMSKQFIPDIITSECVFPSGADIVIDAHTLPVGDLSLRAIVMVDVLHHISDPRLFLSEASRCVRSGGVIAMIEPWVNFWSKTIYQNFHHEPFLPDETAWSLSRNASAASANGALPWIMLHRDRARFEAEFPEWEIRLVKPIMPLVYLLSGGIAMRKLMFGKSYRLWRTLERPLEPYMGMFACIVLLKK
jgi:SAM-dependent methyltransferase